MAGYFRNIPIRRKLTMVMVASTTAGLALAGIVLIGYTWVTASANAVRDLDTLSLIVADNTAVAVAFDDASVAVEMLGALRAKRDIELACLYARGRPGRFALFAQYVAPGGSGRTCAATPDAAPPSDAAHLQVVRPVSMNGEQVGLLHLTQNLDVQREALAAQIVLMAAILGVSLLISFGIAWAMQNVFVGPVLQLAAVARRVSESRDYALRAPAQGGDEVGRLVEDFNGMLAQIAQRDAELNRAEQAQRELNHSLEVQVKETRRALDRLREAQAQLVQNEKLASLGSLVAGVAHEINTPVGIGVTAASTLQANAAQLRQQYEGGALRRSDLERFVGVAEECSHIILKNLQRGAELIHSFKQVAVDQSSGERRRFALKAYLDEVLLSLRPQLKKTPFTVQVDCPEGVVLDSYPGALAQIITNFVNNSIIHGFAGRDHGTIRIETRQESDWVTLRYADDGVGIPRENQPRVFDPFFTTRRGSGGSGLGLHIVYNLVAQLLGGTIEVASPPGRGTEFTIRFPARAQREAA